MSSVTEYLRVNRVPADIREKVQEFYFHSFPAGKMVERSVLDSLSPGLKAEVLQAKFERMGLSKIFPFVNDASLGFRKDFAQHLRDFRTPHGHGLTG